MKKQVSPKNTLVSTTDLESAVDELAQATNRGFQQIQKNMATKEDLKDFEERLENKLDNAVKQIFDKIDVAVELRKTDLLGVTEDEVRNNIRKTDDHEERLTTLERHAGIAI